MRPGDRPEQDLAATLGADSVGEAFDRLPESLGAAIVAYTGAAVLVSG